MPFCAPCAASVTPPRRAGLSAAGALVLLGSMTLPAGLQAGAGGNAVSVQAGPVEKPQHVPGRILVKFRTRLDGSSKASPALNALLGDGLQKARPLARRQLGPLPAGLDRLFAVEVPEAADIPRLAAKLSRLPDVEYAEPVYIYELVGDPLPPGLQAAPNDPQYGTANQAYLTPLQVEAAWDSVRGEDTDPVVCVVDGGTNWQHEDLQANMWVNPGEIAGNGVDDDGNGYVDDIHGWNFQSNNGNPRGSQSTPSSANHGTHTGGLLAAVTHNGVGMASTSWNPRLMAVNAAGSSDNAIFFGYEGIIYAAENGARIVSLSWGGSSGSDALQDIIDFAVAQGVLVIAAAGNGNTNLPFYPAAYRNVYAVANVHHLAPNTDKRYSTASGSNYGGWLDVAAPGVSIYSTFDFNTTNSYGNSTGTSMSSPVAAAVAALIQARHPTWGPLKVGEQLRVTCDNINAVNPGFEDLLGKGRVNARRAVTESSPGVRVTGWTFADADGNGELNQGEMVTMSVDVHNYLQAASGLTLALTANPSYVTVTDGSESAGTLAEDADAALPGAFTFTVAASTPPGTRTDLRIDMTAAGYTDFQWLPITIEPIVETHDINNLQVSLTSSGNIGWIGFPGGVNGEEGFGLRFAGGPNVLFEGALLLGTSPTALSDAARTNREHTDFAPADNMPPVRTTPGLESDQEIQAPFVDSANFTTRLNARVELATRAFATPPYDDFVFLGYEVTNTSGSAFNDLWIGLFFDWDIDELHYDTNRAAWDPSRYLGYAWDTSDPSLPYVGVMTFTGGPQVGYSAIRNDGVGQTVNIYDGFSKSEKWDVLQGGTGFLQAGPQDISNALSVGPYDVAPGDSVTVWFGLLAGTDLADLQANADHAVAIFGQLISTGVEEPFPEAQQAPPARLRLGQAIPNPFNPATRFELQVDRLRRVSLGIYDVRGRLVRALLDREHSPGSFHIRWDGRDDSGFRLSSGVYFARLFSEREIQVQRLILAK